MPHSVLGAALALAVTAISAYAADNSLGTWKLNVAKSTYTGAPMPVKSLTVTRESAEGGAKVTTNGERADGTQINASYTVKYGAAEVPVTGNAPYDSVSVKQKNENNFSDERKKSGGPYHATGRTVISGDGKTMTMTTKGTNGDGKKFTSTFVFEKQ